jgi:hypothetical protein
MVTIGARRIQQPRHSQHAVAVELHGVEVFIVKAAVDHVDRLRSLGGPHVDEATTAEQVPAFNKFSTHSSCQERVFKVCGVVDTRSENNNRRVVNVAGAAAAKAR